MANHSQCNILREKKSWYPTRLIDCGDYGGLNTHCRLIETRDSSVQGPYMTLSHRWGAADSTQLTTENYHHLSNGIQLDVLPQLYRDAVYVARQLRIRYLWVDSLCILQQGDDHADLERELPQMSKIYSQSFCNISAAETMDAHHSLFHTRNQHAISPEIANLSFNGIPTPFLVSDILFWDKDVSHCCGSAVRKMRPRYIPMDCPWRYSGPAGESKPLPQIILWVQNNGGNLAVYEAWARIVQAYTACDLTFPSDKLVAISGIAKMVRSILNDEYVAGMWRLHLDREILWVKSPAFRPDGPGILDSPYRAPTWSWAAVDGKVGLGHIYIQDASILLRVEHVELQHVSGDPMGRICGGYLKLNGVLKKLVLLPHFPVAKGFESWEMVINGTHFRAFDDSSMEEPPFRVYLDRSRSTNGSDLGSGHLFCMPARVRDGPSGSIYVLLLEALDTTKGVFRRIGIARGWGTDVKAKILSQGVHVGEDGFPCERYSDGQHMILVV
ncbi:hypothetical protein PG990_013780 [Apiospora arundinis]